MSVLILILLGFVLFQAFGYLIHEGSFLAVEEELAAANQHINLAADAMGTEDWDRAEANAAAARDDVIRAYAAYDENAELVAPEDRPVLVDSLVVYRGIAQIYLDAARISRQSDALAAAIETATGDEVFSFYTEYEVLARGYESLATQMSELATEIDRVLQNPRSAEYLALTGEDADGYRSSATEFKDVANQFRGLTEDAEDDGYKPIDDRELPREGALHPDSPYFTPEIRALFDPFDQDASQSIDLGEAQNFFFWVEDHITYRYDDEDYPDPNPGSPVGDGRPGKDFHQPPATTLAERMGDCEDMNGLEVAFYNYWGITAYQAYVNAVSAYSIDHAIAIVYVGADAAEAKQTLGHIVTYSFDATNKFGIPAGAYMLVDNAYSDAFGYVDGQGIDPGRFQIFEVHPLGEIFDREIR